jgi:predicted transposase YbfD/YdcC
LRSGWAGLQCFVQVHRSVRQKDRLTEEMAYFISSLPATTPAAVFGAGIRGHWRIENTLHYVKDVTMKEDASKTRTKNAPQNISLMKNLALNLLRQAGYTNIAQAIRLVANDIPKIWEMVSA